MAKKSARRKAPAKRTPGKRSSKKKTARKKISVSSTFRPRKSGDAFAPADDKVHVYGDAQTCDTNSRGFATPENRPPTEIVLDASEGFIPLWAENVTLRWRFSENSLRYFQDPTAVKQALRELLGEAILAWGDAAPVRFRETQDVWDFEVVMRNSDNCSINGCTLASAFFPDPGRHELVLYPKMFTQDRKEQIDTFIHEMGHIFGLRHFFANVSERAWPSVVFGKHTPFSIMNYGANSELTNDDKSDLKLLYDKAWNNELAAINGTNIVFVEPYHRLDRYGGVGACA